MMILVMVHRHNPETMIAHFDKYNVCRFASYWIRDNVSNSNQFLHDHYSDIALYSIEPDNQVERRRVYRPFEGWIDLDS